MRGKLARRSVSCLWWKKSFLSSNLIRSASNITYQHEHAVPRLPIPPLEETLKRYIQYITPLCTAAHVQHNQELVEAFLKNEGPILQNELLALDKESSPESSWLEGLWDTMYLEIRDSSMINVNPYLILHDPRSETCMFRRSASLIRGTVDFQLKLLAKSLAPDMEKTTPLCMSQYIKALGTAKIPHLTRDTLEHYPESRHITVLVRNQFFILEVISPNGQPVSEDALINSLKAIEQQSEAKSGISPPLSVLTSSNRDFWATVRSQHGLSSKLQQVDSSLFVLSLDVDHKPSNLSDSTSIFLHNQGINRWFDKFQYIVCQNGLSAINFEHSPVDGHTMIRLAHEVNEYLGNPDKNTKNSEANSTKFHKIDFDWNRNLLNQIAEAQDAANKLANGTENYVIDWKQYGKKFITGKKFSPDAYVQMAFQSAAHNVFAGLNGNLPYSTYESAMMKHFKKGRTETLRSVTDSSVEWTNGFAQWRKNKNDVNAKNKAISLLHIATEAHVNRLKECKKGEGVDRHLYGLNCLAKLKRTRLANFSIPKLFGDPAYSTLTTSVLSTSNCGSDALQLFGFGAVASNGVGLGYMIQNAGIPITVSSWEEGLATRFGKQLETDLKELESLLS